MYKCKNCKQRESIKARFVKFIYTNLYQQGTNEKLNKKIQQQIGFKAHGSSFRTIVKCLKVSARPVFVQVKTFAEKNYAKQKTVSAEVIIELDEMWHFLGSKKTRFDRGGLLQNN